LPETSSRRMATGSSFRNRSCRRAVVRLGRASLSPSLSEPSAPRLSSRCHVRSRLGAGQAASISLVHSPSRAFISVVTAAPKSKAASSKRRGRGSRWLAAASGCGFCSHTSGMGARSPAAVGRSTGSHPDRVSPSGGDCRVTAMTAADKSPADAGLVASLLALRGRARSTHRNPVCHRS
jgi:hypothetical protein